MPRRALVTGATGVLGPTVVAMLTDQGWEVRTLSRRAPAPGVLPPTADVRIGDITDRAALVSALDGIEVVIHLAALLHLPRPTASQLLEYDRVNVSGTALLVECARTAGVARVVLASSICVYGGNRGLTLREDMPLRPETAYARSKVAAERLVLAARSSDGAPLGTVIRLAAVYGPRVRGNYVRLLNALRRGRFVWIGDGSNRRALIHADDAARSLIVAAIHPVAAGGIFNASDGEAYTMRRIVTAMCAALAVHAPRAAVPVGLATAMSRAADRLLALAGWPPVCTPTVAKILEDVVVDSSALSRDLGFVPRVSLDDGWRRVAASLRRSGERA